MTENVGASFLKTRIEHNCVGIEGEKKGNSDVDLFINNLCRRVEAWRGASTLRDFV